MIYACLSDIHGRGNELLKCINYIEAKREMYKNMKVVFLGDYCDRGHENLLVLDTILDYKKKYPETITVMGNHDEFIIGALWYNKLKKDSYIRELHSSPRSVYNIWTYFPNGGSHTYWELVHKCEDFGEDISNLGKTNTCKNKSIKKYIKFLADNPQIVIEDGVVFSHAPIPRNIYKTIESLKYITSHDVLWNIGMFKVTNGDRYLNIHGHLHLEGDRAKIVEEGLYIDCATEPNVSVSFIDTENPVSEMLIDSFCPKEEIDIKEELDNFFLEKYLNQKKG